MQETLALATFVAETRFADLPPSLVAECKINVLDACGAGFVGASLPWAQAVVGLVRDLGGASEAVVLGSPWRTDVSRAALANGALIGAFECEPLTGSHAAGTVLPAALALAERERASGQALLTALAVGYELSGRLQRTAVGLEHTRGFHNPGTQGPFGAAAAAGSLLGFDAARMAAALGLAGSCAAGLLEFAWKGADTKRVHLGRASQLGLESALLAARGLVGPDTVLEGPYGYFKAFSEPTDLGQLTDGLGRRWIIQPPSHKAYGTHVTQQSVVAAIQAWKAAGGADPAAITALSIRGIPRIMEDRHAVRDPETVMGGQYSLPFTTAVALTRDLDQPLNYDAAAVADPQVRRLAALVELIPEPPAEPPGQHVFPAEITITCGDAVHKLRTSPHKGSPVNPLTWADAAEKFARYAGTLLPPAQVASIVAAVETLEQAPDVAPVAALLAGRA